MSEIVLNAEIREVTGKHAKYARKEGKVPGIFYAHGEKNITINVPKLSLDPLIYTSETHVIDLRLSDGTAKKAILRDVQFDPVSDRAIHFDLQGLRENEKLTLEIPIVLTGGIPKGVRDGGLVQHMIHKLKVSCLPKDIPGRIELNIGELEINHSLHVKDLNVQNVTILENLDSPVVSIVPPTVVKEPEPTAVVEAVPTEPEVVGKGKKTEEGEEGEAAPPAKVEAKPAAKEEKKK
ncbi:MAG TPA: 50S ribosomal protein L25 [Bacteroidota bacterium]|nr:50S ribosomal protein L25 [Bacteroidota bacterium]